MPEVFAPEWTYDADVEGGGLFASAYSATFVKIDSNGVWDNSLFSSLQVYRGPSSPGSTEQVRIRADGAEDTLVIGVVDRKRIAFEGGVVGSIHGRDLLVLALERQPATAYTIKKGTPVGEAIQTLLSEAGIGVSFFGYNYKLGQDFPVVTNRTIGEYVEELLTPLRWSERHRVDGWMDGSRLTLAPRSSFARGSVSIPYDRVILQGMDVDAVGAVDTSVRVEAAQYERIVEQLAEPYTRRTVDEQVEEKGVITTRTVTTTTEYYDACLLHRTEKEVYVTHSTSWVTNYEWHRDLVVTSSEFFRGEDDDPRTGKVSRQIETHTRSASWFVTLLPGPPWTLPDSSYRKVKETTRRWEYFANGAPARELTTEIEYHLGTGEEIKRRTLNYRYSRSGNQTLREWEVREVDTLTGEATTTFGSNEVVSHGPDAGDDVPTGVVTPPCMERETVQCAAGPEDADIVFSSALLACSAEGGGSESADAAAIRALILSDYTNLRCRVALRMLADVRVKPGMQLTVTGAPSYWPATSFYVMSVRASGDGSGIDQEVQGLAWV